MKGERREEEITVISFIETFPSVKETQLKLWIVSIKSGDIS